MFGERRTGSMMCPGCGQLVGVNDESCYHCGRRRPGLWGLSGMLGQLGFDAGFVPLVLWACGALYLSMLVVSGDEIRSGGLFSFLAPSPHSSLRFGASGAVPVVVLGRWWTVLSAGWLHGSLPHIIFNMMAVRDLAPLTAHLYGPARTVILYTVASVVGFTASTLAGVFLRGVPFVGGGDITLGASAAIFGLLGALLYYGRRGGSGMIGEAAKRWILSGLIFGFVVPGIDNWAHLGGLAGGYLGARYLDPMHPERGDHVIWAVVCLALSAAAIVASVVVDRAMFG